MGGGGGGVDCIGVTLFFSFNPYLFVSGGLPIYEYLRMIKKTKTHHN